MIVEMSLLHLILFGNNSLIIHFLNNHLKHQIEFLDCLKLTRSFYNVQLQLFQVLETPFESCQTPRTCVFGRALRICIDINM